MNAFGTLLCDLINPGLVRWQLTIYLDAVAENGRNPVSKHQVQPLSVENQGANKGRDGQSRLAKTEYQARTGAEKSSFSLFS